MATNAVEGNGNGNAPVYKTSIVRSIATDAILGAGFGYVSPYLFKPDVDTFVTQGSEILGKSTDAGALKKAVSEGRHSLDNLIKLDKKSLAQTLEKEPEVLKEFNTVLAKFKNQNALKQTGVGAILCGAIGLVFGLMNRSIEKKAIKKAAQE